MSRRKSKPLEPVTLLFIPDENVDFCGNLYAKFLLSKSKQSLVYKKDDVKEASSKNISNSDNKSRSSSRLSKAPFSERANFRKTAATVETAETNRNESQPQTPKRPRRVSKPGKNSFDDFKVMQNRSISESNKFNTEAPRRNSKRIQAISENKIASKSSPLSNKILKRHASQSNSKIPKRQAEKSYCHESSSTSADECSLSESGEIGSKIPSGARMQNVLKKTNSDSISTPRKNVHKSDTNRMASGFSTPKSKQKTDMKSLQTPARVRKKIKTRFAAMSKRVETDDQSSGVDELEPSSDEYVPSSSAETDSSESEEDSDSSNSEIETVEEKESNLKSTLLGKKKTIDVDLPYKVDADDYFLSKCSKEPTSNNQLSSLEVSHLEEDEITNLLRNEYTKHETNMDLLVHKYKTDFSKWLFYLKENFNLLMYGLGSKIDLLEYFHSEILAMHDVLTIHGYFPRLSVKDILSSLITDVLKISAPKNASEALPAIKSILQSQKSPVFIIIHNVDRLIYRQRKHQSIISKLASFPNLHMIMTIDHINAPLLWGNSMLTELNLVWMNITTYQPYVNETSFENLIYLNEAGTDFVSLSSLRNIFKPLAPRVKKIFRIIAKERLENANNRQYKGMSYEKWYHRAKEELLVNNITVFKVQLTELIDHGIIKTNNYQYIPILVKLDILDKFYKEMYNNEEE